jgi:hypothetical protein
LKYSDENETVGTVIGKYATDKICINNNEFCSGNLFRFLKVESAANMLQIGFEAFCGLLPKQFGVDTQNQLIPYLKESNTVDNLRFTIYVRDTGSRMTIGTPDDFSKFVFSPLVTDPEQWQVDLVTITAAEAYQITSLVFDTGSAFMYMSSSDLGKLMRSFRLPLCSIENRELSCWCQPDVNVNIYFPTQEIVIGSFQQQVKLVMKGSSYMYYNGKGKCVSLFREKAALNDKKYWIMGMPMFRAFDILHEIEASRIGFAGVFNSSVVQLVKSSASTNSSWVVASSGLSMVFGLSLLLS